MHKIRGYILQPTIEALSILGSATSSELVNKTLFIAGDTITSKLVKNYEKDRKIKVATCINKCIGYGYITFDVKMTKSLKTEVYTLDNRMIKINGEWFFNRGV